MHHINSSEKIEQGSGSTLGKIHRSDFRMVVHLLLSEELGVVPFVEEEEESWEW